MTNKEVSSRNPTPDTTRVCKTGLVNNEDMFDSAVYLSGIKSGETFFSDVNDYHDFFRVYPKKKHRINDMKHPWDGGVAATAFKISSIPVGITAILAANNGFGHTYFTAIILMVMLAVLMASTMKFEKKYFSVSVLTETTNDDISEVNPYPLYERIALMENIERDNELWVMFDDYLDVYTKMMNEPIVHYESHRAFMKVLRHKKSIMMDIVNNVKSIDKGFIDDIDQINAQGILSQYGVAA